MKAYVLCVLVGSILIAPSLVAQTNVTTQSSIPEEARKHFIMGATLFKDAKTPDDYAQVESQFKQAVDLAPQWPDPRYNLALTKEAAGDYAGAIADLKIYLQFKLPDTEARTAQDKIYALEAKQQKIMDAANSLAARFEKFVQTLNGGVWETEKYRSSFLAIKITNNVLRVYFISGSRSPHLDNAFDSDLGNYYYASQPIDVSREIHALTFDFLPKTPFGGCMIDDCEDTIHGTISEDGRTITTTGVGSHGGGPFTIIFKRTK